MLPFGQMFVYGLQHVMSMYAGVVAVPLIVGNAFGLPPADITFLISAGLLMSGLATILQTIGFWKLGARQPIVQGTSFAAVSTILAIGATSGGGPEALREVYGAVIVAGIVAFLIAPFFTMLLRFFPEVVTGVVITVIGISLLPVAMRWAGGGNPAAENFASPQNIALAFATVAIIVLIYRFLPGGFGRVAILLGLVLGTVVAIPFGMTNFSRIGDASIFQLTLPFHFGLPTFAIGAIISMFVVMLVTMVETTADILAIGKIIDQPASRQQVTNGLRADMLSSSVSAVFNGFTVSAFAQNVGLVAITGIKSRFVVAVGGGILVFLGLFPILGRPGRPGSVPGPGRRRPGPVRHGGGERHPYPVDGQVRRQLQPRHRRLVDRGRRHPDRGADVLGQLPGVVPGDLRQRHHLGGRHGRDPEHRLQHHRPPRGGRGPDLRRSADPRCDHRPGRGSTDRAHRASRPGSVGRPRRLRRDARFRRQAQALTKPSLRTCSLTYRRKDQS